MTYIQHPITKTLISYEDYKQGFSFPPEKPDYSPLFIAVVTAAAIAGVALGVVL